MLNNDLRFLICFCGKEIIHTKKATIIHCPYCEYVHILKRTNKKGADKKGAD